LEECKFYLSHHKKSENTQLIINSRSSIERDHKAIQVCKRGQPSVAVKIDGANQPAYGRQLEETDTLYSEISRKSIDTLKEFYRPDVTMEEWGLIKKMKPLFDIS
jgi:translation initiation factor 5B